MTSAKGHGLVPHSQVIVPYISIQQIATNLGNEMLATRYCIIKKRHSRTAFRFCYSKINVRRENFLGEITKSRFLELMVRQISTRIYASSDIFTQVKRMLSLLMFQAW